MRITSKPGGGKEEEEGADQSLGQREDREKNTKEYPRVAGKMSLENLDDRTMVFCFPLSLPVKSDVDSQPHWPCSLPWAGFLGLPREIMPLLPDLASQ